VGTYEGRLSTRQARAIYERDEPEIILLAGGTDNGGDTETQLHNARKLAAAAKYAKYSDYGVPVIYAGNQDIAERIDNIFCYKDIDIRVTPNVMPEINEFRIEVVNEAIRNLFQTVIIRGKGFDVVEEYMDAPFIPTPRAAFRGINLLANGYNGEEGLGDILALDIGGATTDFYSNVGDNPLYLFPDDDPQRKVKRTILKTPNVPLVYRRVEGKYGLSYNAENLKELQRYQSGTMARELSQYLAARFPQEFGSGNDQFRHFVRSRNGSSQVDLDDYLSWITQNPHEMPTTTLRPGRRNRDLLFAVRCQLLQPAGDHAAHWWHHLPQDARSRTRLRGGFGADCQGGATQFPRAVQTAAHGVGVAGRQIPGQRPRRAVRARLSRAGAAGDEARAGAVGCRCPGA
jgi:hypothetical protein